MDEVSRRSVHDGVNCPEQGRPGLVVEADDHARAGQVGSEPAGSFAPEDKESANYNRGYGIKDRVLASYASGQGLTPAESEWFSSFLLDAKR